MAEPLPAIVSGLYALPSFDFPHSGTLELLSVSGVEITQCSGFSNAGKHKAT